MPLWAVSTPAPSRSFRQKQLHPLSCLRTISKAPLRFISICRLNSWNSIASLWSSSASSETALGSDYSGSDEPDTIRLLQEELEALPDREDVLRRDWEHHLTHLRGVFDQVLKGMNDIRS